MNSPATEDWGYDGVVAVDFEGEDTDDDVNILQYLRTVVLPDTNTIVALVHPQIVFIIHHCDMDDVTPTIVPDSMLEYTYYGHPAVCGHKAQLLYSTYYSLRTGIFSHMKQHSLPNLNMTAHKLNGDDVYEGTFCVTAVYGSREHKSEMVCLSPCLAIDNDDGRDAVSEKLRGDADTLRHVAKDFAVLYNDSSIGEFSKDNLTIGTMFIMDVSGYTEDQKFDSRGTGLVSTDQLEGRQPSNDSSTGRHYIRVMLIKHMWNDYRWEDVSGDDTIWLIVLDTGVIHVDKLNGFARYIRRVDTAMMDNDVLKPIFETAPLCWPAVVTNDAFGVNSRKNVTLTVGDKIQARIVRSSAQMDKVTVTDVQVEEVF